MIHESTIRAAAVVAAVALLAAPYWRVIARRVSEAAAAAKPYAADASRFAAACLLIVAVVGVRGMPLSMDLTPSSVVTLLKVIVGLGFVGHAFSEAAQSVRQRLEHKAL